MTAKYDPAAHIFNWARNDQTLHKKMQILRVPGNFMKETGQAASAALLASEAYWDGMRAGDISSAYVNSADILRAAILFVEWDGES